MSARIREGCDCGCNDPVATDPRGMLEFLSNRFKHAGVSHAVAEVYAHDIDKILADMQPAPATEQATIAQAFAVDYPKPTASHTSVLMRHADHWQAYEKGWIAATQVERVQRSEDVLVFAIQVEKMLCAALGREWSTAGISIESLIAELTRRATASKVELDANRWKFFVATLDEAEGNGAGANMTRIVDEAIAKAKVGMTALKAAIAATTKQGTP